MDKLTKCREIRIRGVNVSMFKTVAGKIGENMDKVLGRELTAIANSYPDILPERKCEPCGEIWVRSLGASTVEKLKEIAAYENVTLSDFVKVKLTDRLLNGNKKAQSFD